MKRPAVEIRLNGHSVFLSDPLQMIMRGVINGTFPMMPKPGLSIELVVTADGRKHRFPAGSVPDFETGCDEPKKPKKTTASRPAGRPRAPVSARSR